MNKNFKEEGKEKILKTKMVGRVSKAIDDLNKVRNDLIELEVQMFMSSRERSETEWEAENGNKDKKREIWNN